MPNWTVERKCAGLLASASARPAPMRPPSLNCCKRALRADTIAISDITKTPLRMIRMARTMIVISQEKLFMR